MFLSVDTDQDLVVQDSMEVMVAMEVKQIFRILWIMWNYMKNNRINLFSLLFIIMIRLVRLLARQLCALQLNLNTKCVKCEVWPVNNQLLFMTSYKWPHFEFNQTTFWIDQDLVWCRLYNYLPLTMKWVLFCIVFEMCYSATQIFIVQERSKVWSFIENNFFLAFDSSQQAALAQNMATIIMATIAATTKRAKHFFIHKHHSPKKTSIKQSTPRFISRNNHAKNAEFNMNI